jgi:hypothetical protein
MKHKFVLLVAALLAAPLVVQQAAAQSTLTPALLADRAAVQAAQVVVQSAVSKLRSDEAAGNAVAVAADRTALRLAQLQVAQDFDALRQDARSILEPDLAGLIAALTQLHTDQLGNLASALPTDQAAVAAAELLLKTDRTAILGGLGERAGAHERMRR